MVATVNGQGAAFGSAASDGCSLFVPAACALHSRSHPTASGSSSIWHPRLRPPRRPSTSRSTGSRDGTSRHRLPSILVSLKNAATRYMAFRSARSAAVFALPVLDRRVRAVLEQQPGDFQCLGLVIGREIHEERLAIVASGTFRLFREELAQPIDTAGVADFPGAAAVPGEQVDHSSGLAVHRAAERCLVVLTADRIDVGTARDQELADVDGIVIRRDVERALALGAFDVW